jgi:hypothetical protein
VKNFIDLPGIQIKTDDVKTLLPEMNGQGQPYIAKADDADPSRSFPYHLQQL